MTPLVTIVIPAFNQRMYIAKAIESALQQDYANLQVIVGDDCSTDGMNEVATDYDLDNRFRYIRNSKNIGRVANYRKLLYEHAEGEWYMNLDGDDYLTDNSFVSKCVDWIQQYKDVVIVSAATGTLDKNGVLGLRKSRYDEVVKLVEGKDFFLDLPSEKAWVTHLGTLFNRNKAIEIGFYREDILSTDYESLHRLALMGNIVCYQKPVAVWRMHDSNASVNKFSKPAHVTDNFKGIENVASFAFSFLPEQTVKKWRRQMIIKNLKGYSAVILLKRPKNSMKVLFGMFRKYPGYFVQAIAKLIGEKL